MDFEWDETKRQSNIAKHGLDFLDGAAIFTAPYFEARANAVNGEIRWKATGMIDDLVVTAIFTRRDDAIRLISLRRARNEERSHYHALFDEGDRGPPRSWRES